ncbi:D-galactarate dehydratase [Litoreibacter roseus]|uniref:D-galactarate dehydratase n=1 Tax=Litoreibacter roseus TaxID=2601869 RepID=A0A6N6JHE3_9RHOB|nr:D-galactarate dehydratase [Litoreibacter roseus]GFE65773.1 hypothetical protein KIN_28470 [Litoreibacter roseus]
MKNIALISLIVLLPACGQIQYALGIPSAPPPPPPDRPASQSADVAGVAPASLDTTTAAQRAQATQPTSGGQALGQTVASLGDPTDAGLWLRTPLVTAETPGRVETATGNSVRLTLIPIEGEASAGSRISLSAMRALGLNLTDLPTLAVYSG